MARSFAETLNELLRGSSMSGNRFAQRIGVDASQVSRWRKSEGVPRPDNIGAIAALFGVDYDWLMDIAYPNSRPAPIAARLNPRLSSLLAEIETGWLAMDSEAERDIAERGARALFAVQPLNRGVANGRRDGARNRQVPTSRDLPVQPEHEGDSGNNRHVTIDYRHPLRSVSRSMLSALMRLFPLQSNHGPVHGRLLTAGA